MSKIVVYSDTGILIRDCDETGQAEPPVEKRESGSDTMVFQVPNS